VTDRFNYRVGPKRHTCIPPLVTFPKTVLGHLLFFMYAIPLSTLTSSLSLNHRLYADDTQLFFSFHPPNFDWSITRLQNDLHHISSWTTASLWTLRSSETEFLLIGLKSNLTMYTILHWTPPTLLAISASSSTTTSPLPTRSDHLSSNLAIVKFVNFALSALISIPKQPLPLPPPSFPPNLITVILYATTSLSLR